jgi:iron complex outermembrane receptor protein
LAGAAFAVLQLAASPTHAAEPAKPAAESAGIGEVVVTARKVQENIIQVPVAVTALTALDLTRRGITDYENLEDFTPGFHYESAETGRNDRNLENFVIRGMYPADVEPDRASVSIFMNGVPIEGGVIGSLGDIDRVEVVNGPQSAFFGRSTFSGAVNFITRTPSSTPTATIDATLGQWDTADVKVSAEGPIIKDVLTGRASFREYNFGGQYSDYGYGGDKLGARATQAGAIDLNFTPISGFRSNLYVTYWQDHDGPSAQGLVTATNCKFPGGTQAYFCGAYSSTPASTITQQRFSQTAIDVVSATDVIQGGDAYDKEGMYRQAAQGVLTADYDLPSNFTLSFNGGLGFDHTQNYTDAENNAATPGKLAYVPEKMYSGSGEIRLTSPQTGKLKYLVGFNYVTSGLDFDTDVYIGAPKALTVAPPVGIFNHTYGFFGSASYDFTEKLSLDVELRYQIDQLYEKVYLTTHTDAATFDAFTPRVILKYQIDPSVQAYASYSQGTRPGQFNIALLGLTAPQQAQIQAQGAIPEALPEETLSMEELGLKGNFFDNKLRILADVYYGDWKNINVSRNTDYTNAGTVSFIVLTEAGGEADLYGVELQTTFKPTPEWTFDGTFDYAGTKIVTTNCLECLAIVGNADPTGKSLPRYPITSGTFSATYRRPAFADFDGYIRADYIYTGKQYDTDANTAWIPDSNRFNARIGIQNGHYTVEVFGKNIFNDKTPISITGAATNYVTGGYGLDLSPAILQTFGVRLVARY